MIKWMNETDFGMVLEVPCTTDGNNLDAQVTVVADG